MNADGSLVVRPHVRERHPLRAGAGRSRRHEMRRARQYLGHRRRAASGSMRRPAACSARCACRSWSANLAWGGEDFHTLFMTATHSVYTVQDQGRPAHRALYAQPRRRRDGERAARGAPIAHRRRRCSLDPSRCAMIIQDLQNDVIMDGGAFASSGSPAHARAAERGRERAPARRCLPRARRAGDPRLVHRRAGRARHDAQRAAVRGRGRQQGDGARQLGRGAGRAGSSRGRATSWSRRCA